jgi:hypothetical protein
MMKNNNLNDLPLYLMNNKHDHCMLELEHKLEHKLESKDEEMVKD